MKQNGLLYLMIAGIILGIISGWMFGNTMLAVGWIGEMFLDALKMLVVPLIISSMIVGMVRNIDSVASISSFVISRPGKPNIHCLRILSAINS